MDVACSSPSAAKGVVIGAMTPKGIFSGMIMIGTGSGVFDLAYCSLVGPLNGVDELFSIHDDCNVVFWRLPHSQVSDFA